MLTGRRWFRDLYAALGVSRQAGYEELRRAYRGVVVQTHPDVAGPGQEARLRAATAAWAVLGDPQPRAVYDALLTLPPGTSPDDLVNRCAWTAAPMLVLGPARRQGPCAGRSLLIRPAIVAWRSALDSWRGPTACERPRHRPLAPVRIWSLQRCPPPHHRWTGPGRSASIWKRTHRPWLDRRAPGQRSWRVWPGSSSGSWS